MARRFGPGFIATEAQGARITVSSRGRTKSWEALYTPASEAIVVAKRFDDEFVPPPKPILLASGDREAKKVVLYPHILDATSPRFLLPRYETLRTITLSGFGNEFLNEIKDFDSLSYYIRMLPPGLIRDPYYGLGLVYEIRQIVFAIEELNVTDLQILKGARGESRLVNKAYELPFAIFDSARLEINRIHNKALNVAREEKTARVLTTH